MSHDKWTTTAIIKPPEQPSRSWWVTSSDEEFTKELRKEIPRLKQIPGKEAYKSGGGME
jgi:hypothetical protein